LTYFLFQVMDFLPCPHGRGLFSSPDPRRPLYQVRSRHIQWNPEDKNELFRTLQSIFHILQAKQSCAMGYVRLSPMGSSQKQSQALQDHSRRRLLRSSHLTHSSSGQRREMVSRKGRRSTRIRRRFRPGAEGKCGGKPRPYIAHESGIQKKIMR
jgi:hypothetical protein